MADELTTKVVDGKLEVTKTVSEVQVTTFDYNYLISQRDAIQAQKDRDNEQRDKELEEVNILIQAAKDGGIDKAAEAIPVIK